MRHVNNIPNPFHPAFGTVPPVLVGRDDVIRDVADGIEEGAGSPLRALTITGPRGVGKTVMLNAAQQVALEHGWISVATTASDGMLQEILDLTRKAASHLVDQPARHALTGVNVGGFGVTATVREPAEPGWRVQMEGLLDQLAAAGTGLLITVDEVHAGVPQLEYATKTFQHFFRDGRDVQILFAGLPGAVADMATQPGMTFIWRAERRQLGSVALSAVRAAMRETIEANGRSIDPVTLHQLAAATEGYPYLIQLVGYHTWRHAAEPVITAEDVATGASEARRHLAGTVHEYTLRDLSQADRAFLEAMSVDDGPSKICEVGDRLGKASNQLSVYRQRLLDVGVIAAPGRGLVDFAVPYLREYLRDHAATPGGDQ
jgi:hypothetical protein